MAYAHRQFKIWKTHIVQHCLFRTVQTWHLYGVRSTDTSMAMKSTPMASTATCLRIDNTTNKILGTRYK